MTEEPEEQSQQPIKRMMAMADQLKSAQALVARLTQELTDAKALQTELEQEHMPELMRECGMTSFKSESGEQFDLIDEISCAITKDNHTNAMAWLDKNNFGGLIKTELQLSFNRDDREAAVKMAKELQEKALASGVNVDPLVTETVHAATLKSFIKEEMKKGNAVPFDLFSIHPYSKVKVTPPKKK